MAATTRNALAVKNDFWLRSPATCFSPSETVWSPTQPPLRLRHVCERTIKHLNNELLYLTSHANTFWTDKTSIQEMLISRSSHPKRMAHYSCRVVHISLLSWSWWQTDTGSFTTIYVHLPNALGTKCDTCRELTSRLYLTLFPQHLLPQSHSPDIWGPVQTTNTDMPNMEWK